MSPARSAPLLLVLACGGVSPTQTVTKPPATAHAGDFQLAREQAFREDPTSPLSAVAAYYLGPAEELFLRPTADGSFERVETGGKGVVRFWVEGAGLRASLDGNSRAMERGVVWSLAERASFNASRQETDWRILVHDPQARRVREFAGLKWFPQDPGAALEARFERTQRVAVPLLTSRGLSKVLYTAGVLHFEYDGAPYQMVAFGYAPEAEPAEPLLVPFKDATSGHQSYAAGRYLEPLAPHGDTLLIDFNEATNPLCAYSEYYNCPFPPRENHLPFPVRAGERDPHAGTRGR